MKRVLLLTIMMVAAVGLGAVACMDREPAPVCPVPIELNRTERFVGGYDGVDMLVVVDDSNSMKEEQEILSTQFFTLVNSLVFPTEDWKFPPAPSVRIGIVSSDMGLQYDGGGKNSDGSDKVGELDKDSCKGRGKNGKFQSYEQKTIDINEGEIKCNLDNDLQHQCPEGWECENDGSGELTGHCVDPNGDGSGQSCPSLNAIYTETPLGDDKDKPNYDLAFQAACLADLGTEGCGFEQQLQAAAKGLIHPENNPENDPDKAFYRANYLLAVLIVSDEEDCSIADGDLFKTEEFTDTKSPHKLNIACGRHEDMLYSTDYYLDFFRQVKGDDKNGLDSSTFSTVFAAIVGVPKNDGVDDPNPCEGLGSEIGECLKRNEMEKEEVLKEEGTSKWWSYREACTREEGGTLVTEAKPGRRYVELAQRFHSYSYVSSICNKDWSRAMGEIARLIAAQLQGACYPKPLEWDPEHKIAKCNVVVEYHNADSCPFELEEGAKAVERYETINDVQEKFLDCPLPRLAADINCANAEEDIADLPEDQIGWYYCEDDRENFEEACDPDGPWSGIDEDKDGKTDCKDPGCWRCNVCAEEEGVDTKKAESQCLPSCKFKVELTEEAKKKAHNRKITVQCLQQFTFADSNCQERTHESCNDGKDNDGSGVKDCEDVEGESLADLNCCPMVKGSNGDCIVSDDVDNICDKGKDSKACEYMAEALKCNL